MIEEKIYTIEEIEDIKPYGFIYITTNNINGKKYIGQRKFYRKWKIYLGSGTHLLYAIKKYGKENFSRKIIAVANTKEELDNVEIKFIKEYDAVDSKDYYNINIGGGRSTTGIHWSEESRQKLSKTKTGIKIGNMSEEGKQNMSDAHKGLHHSEETKRKIGEGNKGKIMSEESRRKTSEGNKGKIISQETRKKNSETHRKLTDSQVIEIRDKYATGDYYQYELAEEYGVKKTAINNIINFRGIAYGK